MLNLDLEPVVRDAVHALGVVLEDLDESEPDAALGNGGLGRLAACLLDSLATQAYPTTGFGIRYEYGMFRQELRDGAQVERPDTWLYRGNPGRSRVRMSASGFASAGKPTTAPTPRAACNPIGTTRKPSGPYPRSS